MKKLILFSFAMSMMLGSWAQITVTRNDMPNAGDSVLVSLTNTIGSLDATLTGANYAWDFSSLTYTSQQEIKFDNPTTFPLIYAIPFNFINTSYGRENRNLTGLPMLNITAAYDFLKESTGSLKQVGAGYTIGGTPLPFFYTSNDVIYTFPMNYGNTDSSDYQFGLPIPTIGYYGEKGHRVNVVDGWGTLTLPYNSYQTLRVKSVITSTDTLYISALSFGSNIVRPTRVEYKWLTNGKQIPVLEIDANLLGTTATISNVSYQDIYHSGAGIAENNGNAFALQVFPNPSTDQLVVQYALSNPSPITITVSDVMGKVLTTSVEGVQTAGTHQKWMSTTDLHLAKGVYVITVQSAMAKEVKRWVVE